MRQTFVRPKTSKSDRKVYCEAMIRAVFRGVDGTRLVPADMLAELGASQSSIDLLKSTSIGESYNNLDDQLHQRARDFNAETARSSDS